MAGNANLLQVDGQTINNWQTSLTSVTGAVGNTVTTLQNQLQTLSSLFASYTAAITQINLDIAAGAGQNANTGFPTLALTVQAEANAVQARYTTILAAINAMVAASTPAMPGN